MKSNEEILAEHAAVDLEIKKVELGLKQEQLQKLNDAKDAARIKMERQQRDLKANAKLQAEREAKCSHKKGGRNKAGLEKGNSPNYAIIINTYPWGAVKVHCQRCAKKWEEPAIALRQTNPDRYYELLAEFRKVLEWPTDNEPSGTQLFLITRNDDQRPRAPREEGSGEATTKASKPRIRKPKSERAA